MNERLLEIGEAQLSQQSPQPESAVRIRTDVSSNWPSQRKYQLQRQHLHRPDMKIATTLTPDPAMSTTAPSREKRVWALALGTAAVWYLDPVLAEMAEMVCGVACSANKSMVRDAIVNMRIKATELRGQIGPLPASALAKVVRRTEAAGGAVLDKGARIQEVQTSWDHFLACLRSSPR